MFRNLIKSKRKFARMSPKMRRTVIKTKIRNIGNLRKLVKRR